MPSLDPRRLKIPKFAKLGLRGASASAATSSSVPSIAADIDPSALMRIKNLPLRAKLVVEGFYNGLHRSPLHGASVEFSEYRSYSPGDDPRGLDWKLYARTDRYYVKKFEDETSRRCYLVVDQSRSMGYGSLEYTKMDYARTLAATLAHYLTLHRDQVGVMTFDESIGDVVDARSRTGQLRQIFSALSREVHGGGTDLAGPLAQVAAVSRRRGMVVLISDLLAPHEDLRCSLALLRSRQHEVVILRVLDPAEKEFSFEAAQGIVDVETRRHLHIDPADAKTHYEAAFQTHASQLRSHCDDVGAAYYEISTNTPLREGLGNFVSVHGRRSGAAGRRAIR